MAESYEIDKDMLSRVEDVIEEVILPKSSENPEIIKNVCLGVQTLSRSQAANPLINRTNGIVEYNLIDKYINADDVLKAFSLLEDLGMVKRTPASAVLKCPKCHSTRLRPYFVCRFCGSPLVIKTRLIQHIVCGYTGEEEEFVKGKRLICPKCGLELKQEGTDYIVIAEIFKCLNCGARQRNPEIQIECLECGHNFKPLEGKYELLYKFEPTEVGLRLWKSGLWELAFFRLVARDLGYRVRVNSKPPIPGAEGYSYNLEIRVRAGLRRLYRIYVDSESFFHETFGERSTAIARLKSNIMREGREVYILIAMPDWEKRYAGSEFVDYRDVIKGDPSVLLGTRAVIFPNLESNICSQYYQNVRTLIRSIVLNIFGLAQTVKTENVERH